MSASNPFQQKSLAFIESEAFYKTKSGDDLLSHGVTTAVPSALEGLTALFGMGRGVTPPPLPPEFLSVQFELPKSFYQSHKPSAAK